MASNPKSEEAREIALQAVEEALDIDFQNDDHTPQGDPASGDFDPDFAELEQKLAEAAGDLRNESDNTETGSAEDAERDPALTGETVAMAAASPSQRLRGNSSPEIRPAPLEEIDETLAEPGEPANDPQGSSVTDIVYGMQQKPSSRLLWVASLLSLGWLGLCAAYFLIGRNGGRFAGGPAELIADPAVLVFGVMAIVPVLLVFAFAIMMRRAQEMRFAARSLTEAAVRLLQPETVASDSVTSVGRAVRQEVAAISNGVERALARAVELETLVSNEVLNLERSYADSEIRLRGLVKELDHERHEILSHAEELRKTLASSQTGFGEDLSNATDLIKQSIDEASRGISETLAVRQQDITASLSEAGDNLVSLLTGSGAQTRRTLDETAENLREGITQQSNEMARQVNLAGQALATLMETRTAGIREQGESLVGDLQSALETQSGAFAEKTEALLDAMQARTEEFAARLESSGETVQTGIDKRLDAVDGLLETKGQAFVEALGMRTEALDRVLGDRTAAMGETISSSLSGFGKELTGHVDRVVGELGERAESLSATTQSVEKAIDERATSLEEALMERTSGLVGAFSDGDAAIRKTVEEGIAGAGRATAEITSAIDERNTALTGKIDEARSALASTLDERADRLGEDMQQRSAVLLGAIDKRAEAIGTGIESRVEQLTASLDQRTEALDAGLGQRVEQLTTNLDQRTEALDAGLEQRVEQLTTSLDQRTEALDAGLGARVEQLTASLDQRTEALDTNLQTRVEELGASLDRRAEAIDAKVAEHRNLLNADLEVHISAVGGTIDEKSARLADILGQRAEAIKATLGDGLVETQRSLEEQTRQFNTMLIERARELQEILENQARPVVEDIERRGDLVAEKLGVLHETVGGDVNALLDALAKTSDSLQLLLDNAGHNMTAMRETLTAQSTELMAAVDKANRDVEVSSQIAQQAQTRMDETASGLIQNVSGIADRFEEQAKMLEQATRLIDAAQTSFSSTLEDKQEALFGLASGLVDRTQTIESTMASFGEMLNKAMEETTERSRTIGSHVSSEIGTAIEEAGARFAQTVEAMRQAAGELQRDLEETRSEMRRGVMELPDETRESADAMRRVVTDQIAALKELSEIVAKSGKSMDTAQAIEPAERRVAASSGSARPAPAPAASQAAPRQPLRRHPEPPAPPPQGGERRHADEPPPRQRDDYAPQGRDDQPAGGWVSDLLRRASQNDDEPAREPEARSQTVLDRRDAFGTPRDGGGQQRSALHVMESLNSLSMDIARAIDHDAFVDLWDRYQRGERNVFTRRIYTLQGEQTFDEIRAKYGRDREFRTAVDRYVADFEKLLADVSRNDRDNIMTQTYLTSDTGKVYTMLAHAAGRL